MDLASLMNNPQVMQMAQRMAAEGGLERLMQNPALAGMVRISKCDLIHLLNSFLSDEQRTIGK